MQTSPKRFGLHYLSVMQTVVSRVQSPQLKTTSKLPADPIATQTALYRTVAVLRSPQIRIRHLQCDVFHACKRHSPRERQMNAPSRPVPRTRQTQYSSLSSSEWMHPSSAVISTCTYRLAKYQLVHVRSERGLLTVCSHAHGSKCERVVDKKPIMIQRQLSIA
jgi:hypothetical protein